MENVKAGTVATKVHLGFDTALAACRGTDVSAFFPDERQVQKHSYQALYREALKICENCEVREPCLEYALHNESMGIWGGTTEFQRHNMRLGRSISLPDTRPTPDAVRVAMRNQRRRKTGQ